MSSHRPSRLASMVAGRAAVPPPPMGARPTRHDDGIVLLETALAIPLLVAVTLALAWALSLASTAMGLADAARQAARDIARGVDEADAVAAATATVPGARIRVETSDAFITVVAEREVTAPVPILRGLTIPVAQSISVPAEWR